MNGATETRTERWDRIRGAALAAPSVRARRIVGTGLGAFWTVFLLVRLLVPVTVGQADETDGHRYLCQRGLEAVRGTDYPQLYSHVYTTYQTHTWYGETCGTYRGDETKYSSSHEAVIWLGQHLNGLFGMPGALDLRTLAIIYALAIGVAIGLTFALLPGSLLIRLLTTIGIGLVYTESVIAVYFVSPYAEPTVWCGFALLLPALLWYWRAPKVSWPRLALVVGISFFTITAKTQAIGYLPAILLAMLWKRDASKTRVRRHRPQATAWLSLRAKARAATAGVLLVGATGGYLATGGNLTVYSQLNVYEMVFTTLLPAGNDPAGDLRWMGADPALAYASGTTVNGANGAAGDPRLLTFSKNVTQLTVLEFVAAHPTRLIALTKYGLRAMGQWRPAYLGNYPDTPAHRGLQHECRDCLYYSILTPVRAAPFLFGILLVLALGVAFWLRSGRSAPGPQRVMGKVVVFFVTATIGEFWVIQLTQGVGDEIKHHVFTLLPMMLTLPTALSCLALRRRRVVPAPAAAGAAGFDAAAPTTATAAGVGP
ncbi:MAG: hypothetical protein M3042_03620 [Actinomycetota bacterium]|nr:hypothetical protein [Actinomycetota bacterium]